MSKQTPGDHRRDPDEGGASELLVDRVFPVSSNKPKPTKAPAQLHDAELRHQVTRLSRELSEAQRKLADHDDELAAERQMRQAVTSARSKLDAENAELTQRIADLQRRVIEQDGELAAVTAEQQAVLATHAQLTQRLGEAEQRIATQEDELVALDAENVSLTQRLATAVKTVEVLAQQSRTAATPAAVTRAEPEDDLGEEELRVLYGDD